MIHRIVTGARGLIGRALAEHLEACEGELLAVDAEPGPAVGPATERMDCRDEEFTARTGAFLAGAGRVEAFHAAGGVPPLTRIRDLGLSAFRATVEDNLVSTYAAMRAIAEAAVADEVPGSITVLGSVGATKAHRYKAAYDAAAAGIEAMTRCFALEYGPYGISCRVVALGPIAEAPTTAADGSRLDALVRLVPLQRYATLAEIVQAVAVIGSAAFDAANGGVITLDGGLSQQLRPVDVERPPEPANSGTGHDESRRPRV